MTSTPSSPAPGPPSVTGGSGLTARLIPVTVPREPAGAVLVLHGGSARKGQPVVSPGQLSVLRMIPIARQISQTAGGRLAVFRLLNSHRGWNSQHTPVHDARWALGQIGQQLGPGLRTCLVGHSLGGRAALLAANHPSVTSAVALAPWVYPDDRVDAPGRRFLIVHGTADRVASPDRSAAVARSLAATGAASVDYITIDGGKHAMLRHHREFTSLAARFAAATLLGQDTTGTMTGTGIS